MFHKPNGILPKADISLFKVKVSHHIGVRWISTLHPLLITPAEVLLCMALKGLTLYNSPTELTWAMSSKQLKMYFLASFDLIPVSASWSSGVWSRKATGHW